MPELSTLRPRLTEARAGWLAALAGALLAFAIQALAPVGVPLYDGVVVQAPYRFLHPTGDQPGDPTSFSATPAVNGSASPEIAAFTAEQPPQAQLIVLAGGLSLPPGTTSLNVSITPVEPPGQPATGRIAGNVYRFTMTDQDGNPVQVATCEGCASLVLRAPEDTQSAELQRFADGAWTPVETIHAATSGTYYTNPTAFGDYALVTSAPSASGGGGDGGLGAGTGAAVPMEALLLVGGLLVIGGLVGAAVLVRRRQTVPPPPRRSIPSKQRRPPKPPSGRSRS